MSSMGYDIRPEGRGRAVAYRDNYRDAITLAKDRARIDNRVMEIVDVASGQAYEIARPDGSVSPAPDGRSD